MKNFKLLSCLSLAILSAFSLTGCSKYKNSYSALLMIRSNTLHHSYMKFGSFKGLMHFKMNVPNEDYYLTYTLTLETGNATIYYDNDDEKVKLVDVSNNDTITSVKENLVPGTLYIVVETQNECKNGEFEFTLTNVK